MQLLGRTLLQWVTVWPRVEKVNLLINIGVSGSIAFGGYSMSLHEIGQ